MFIWARFRRKFRLPVLTSECLFKRKHSNRHLKRVYRTAMVWQSIKNRKTYFKLFVLCSCTAHRLALVTNCLNSSINDGSVTCSAYFSAYHFYACSEPSRCTLKVNTWLLVVKNKYVVCLGLSKKWLQKRIWTSRSFGRTLWCRTKNFYYLIKCDCADFIFPAIKLKASNDQLWKLVMTVVLVNWF